MSAEGTSFGAYDLLDVIGSGGMGIVHRAYHRALRRHVALKVIRPAVAEKPSVSQRFYRELEVMVGLRHPNVVQLLDTGIVDGVPYIAMELLSGESVRDRVAQSGPLSVGQALAMACDAARALEVLHAQQIIHRDLTPANVFLCRDGPAKVLDFGIARRVNSKTLTAEHEVVGTLIYLSPEVIQTNELSAAADLWALGCVLYHALAGRPHVRGETSVRVLCEIDEARFEPPDRIVPSVPAVVSRFVMRLLDRDPGRRPASAEAVLAECERLLAAHGDALGPEPAPPNEAVGPPTSARTRVLVHVPNREARTAGRRLALVAVLAVTAFAWLVGTRSREPVRVAQRASAHGAVPLTPSPARAPAHPARILWHSLLQEEAGLRRGGPAVSEAIRTLMRRSGLRLGATPPVWLFFLDLGRGLHAGRIPAWPPRGKGIFFDADDEHNVRRWFSDARAVEGGKPRLDLPFRFPHSLSAALITASWWPLDGRCWLALGYCLELEGLNSEADCCFGYGLAHLQGAPKAPLDGNTWHGLVRALIRVPGHSLANEWVTYLDRLGGSATAWDALYHSLRWDQPDLLSKILWAQRFSASELPQLYLGHFFLYVRPHHIWARGALETALAKSPTSERVARALVFQRRAIGEEGEADRFARRYTQSQPDLLYRRYVTGPISASIDELAKAAASDTSVRDLIVSRLLETARLNEAQQLAASEKGEILVGPEGCLDLLGCGDSRPGVLQRCRTDLLESFPSHPDLGLWNRAAGSLSSATGRPAMEALLAEAKTVSPRWTALILVRALWESRSGLLEASLSTLARMPAPLPPYLPELEIVSRPLWFKALGWPVADAVLQRARLFAGQLIPAAGWEEERGYLEALRSGKTADAARFARLIYLRLPTCPGAGLALAFATSATAPVPERPKVFAQLDTAARYLRLGLWYHQHLDKILHAPPAR